MDSAKSEAGGEFGESVLAPARARGKACLFSGRHAVVCERLGRCRSATDDSGLEPRVTIAHFDFPASDLRAKQGEWISCSAGSRKSLAVSCASGRLAPRRRRRPSAT